MKIGVGTVQFGVSYGISNTKGRPSEPEIARILRYAAEAEIQKFTGFRIECGMTE